jgi:CheY-like chemotaxis protein
VRDPARSHDAGHGRLDLPPPPARGSELASIPVVVVSADDRAADLVENGGVYAVLAKPVEVEELLQCLDGLCSK